MIELNMKKIVFYLPVQIVLMSFLLFGCKAQQTMNANLEEAIRAIAASNEIYFQSFAKGDSSLFIGCYTEDCWIMQPNAPTLCGVDAPLDFFRMAYGKVGVRNGKFISIDVFGNDEELVTEVGFWESVDINNNLLDNGKFLVLWKRTPDGWKRFRDSFNSDRNK